MPTFTAIALDSLLEPGPSKSIDKSLPKPKPPNPNLSSMLERRNGKSVAEMKVSRPQIKPELYATPESAPLPLSPSAFSPSPYVINHKRRGPRLLNTFSEVIVSSNPTMKEEESLDKINDLETKVVVTAQNGSSAITGSTSVEERPNGDSEYNQQLQSGHASNNLVRENDLLDDIASNGDDDEESDVFFDPQESMSIASNTDDENAFLAESSQKFQTSTMEFFDSSKEQSSRHDREELVHKLSEMRLNLMMEIDRRKQAEEALSKMKSQWLDIKQQLSSEGLQLHEDPTAAMDDGETDTHPSEDLSQQIYLARFVSEAIGRGTTRAEMDMEMEAQIELKNFEISRLSDRIRYYETVNHEMSQRNQEAVETGRRERLRRRRRKQKWLWSSVAAAITIGTAALAWSYLPSEVESSSSQHPEEER